MQIQPSGRTGLNDSVPGLGAARIGAVAAAVRSRFALLGAGRRGET